jgi:hypothetical protein
LKNLSFAAGVATNFNPRLEKFAAIKSGSARCMFSLATKALHVRRRQQTEQQVFCDYGNMPRANSVMQSYFSAIGFDRK